MIINVVKKISIALILALILTYIVLMIVVATSVFYVSQMQNGLIQNGVFIAGIDVSNLSSDDALNRANSILNENMPEAINLKYKENIYQINLTDIEATFDTEKAINEAYNIGRTKNIVRDLEDYIKVINDKKNIECDFYYNDEKLNKAMAKISEQLPDKVQEYSYEVKNDKLIINKGKNGVGLDCQKLKDLIIPNLQNRNYDEVIEIPTYEILPKAIDVQKIHDEIYTQAQDAYYTENPIVIHEPKIGRSFDVQIAQKYIDSNTDLEKYIINLNLANPNILVKDLNIFPDTLSTFSTKHANNANRTTNLILASSKINGVVLMPGEKFSFNKVVGKRTVEAGYKNAAIFVNGQVEDGLAGGICQVSSTLYDAVIAADLEIKERHNHSKLTSYLPGGKDATVVWGRYDFQFINNREYPIKIEMSVQNGHVIATILGIKSQEEYEICIESEKVGVKGVYTIYNAYKVYKKDGVEVRREFLSRDLYK